MEFWLAISLVLQLAQMAGNFNTHSDSASLAFAMAMEGGRNTAGRGIHAENLLLLVAVFSPDEAVDQ